MPQGKDIYNVLSKKMKDKQRRKGKPTIPPTINNYAVNKPTFAKSLNKHPKPDEKKRVVSPNEGKPAVNASSDVERLIHKPSPKKILDPALAAIKSVDLGEKKKRGRPKKTGEKNERKTKKNVRTRNKKAGDSGEISTGG